VSNAARYIRQDQRQKWQQNRQRLERARQYEEQEAETLRLLNQELAKRQASGPAQNGWAHGVRQG
jgi:hypothetical protein